MAILKCKMCGGTMEMTNESVAVCEYCGTQQTVPTVQDSNLQGLFNRANALRIKCEFDKAEQLYEKIISADNTLAEAYWGLILCKYGIEYVEDPATFKRIPTCHRTSFDSIIADEDYNCAVDFADDASQKLYIAEAKEIDRLQKEILALSQKEEPYDVFICYKETDEDGKRTQDSVIANDIYYQLTQEGFKVFYAAITLEDKLGSAYEPCIFAALNSSKVMLSIGTKPEYFSAVWVKNEWSRFLKMMKKDRSKLLIPCYRDMDAYELPDEFAHLQAQDMSKIGFINDVVRGIKKVIVKEETAPTVVQETVVTNNSVNITPLIERAFMFLEDGDWSSANEYCEKVLDQDPKYAQAYLGKLMAELKVSGKEDLKNCRLPFDEKNNYAKAIRFGDEELVAFLENCTTTIKERNELNRKIDIYQKAKEVLSKAKFISDYEKAVDMFAEISGFKDADELRNEAQNKCDEIKDIIEEERKEKVYKEALAQCNIGDDISIEGGIQKLETIKGYKDVDELLANRNDFYNIKIYKEALRKFAIMTQNLREGILVDMSMKEIRDVIYKLNSISTWSDTQEKLNECYKTMEDIRQPFIEEKERLKNEYDNAKGVFVSKKRQEIQKQLQVVEEKLNKYVL
ncbi:MAG: toll/interleukin-1 receptor domain-containing protein [Ruminococcus sp.]|nr:toll/interleukin-1 receptor domain-containing protein [Ruminococcus sp.]